MKNSFFVLSILIPGLFGGKYVFAYSDIKPEQTVARATINCNDSGSVENAIFCGARDTFGHPGVSVAGMSEREWRALIRALIWRESRFQPNIRSRAGAYGLTQLMPATARSTGLRPEHLSRPYCQVKGGGLYLARMLETFEGDIPRALAGYNAGPANVKKYKGLPPFKETQVYVRDVMQKFKEYKGQSNRRVSQR
ncbi:lytic transglycosylase domain-containing protein [Ochrobactrum teleogrylli]|uniref:Lytic transglycosylase domain-containing protein n=1 Tax=Ochrobactrum teleogrylli TaxID=2479765 RepID=A0ABY2XZE5_9HYPH|nr:lytic transglycosylase domain-containing protein [[Ochrobactrum] teleogrylli]TNV09560.1 lytic transglycosylase domain-containing protein [[Ochrobactrum] teleogrylli]